MTPPVEKLIFVQEASEASLKHGKQKSKNIGQMSAKQTTQSETPFLPYFTGTAAVSGHFKLLRISDSVCFSASHNFLY